MLLYWGLYLSVDELRFHDRVLKCANEQSLG